MPRLDEQSLRRPNFVPGVPVFLGDGQQWELRKPLVRFVPDDNSPTGFATVLTIADDGTFQGLIDKHRISHESDGEKDVDVFIATELAIGRALLLANYDLTPPQVALLLQFGYDKENDPEGVAIRSDVMAVARGQSDPKALTGSAIARSAGGAGFPHTHSGG
jgi:hypothetical protein